VVSGPLPPWASRAKSAVPGAAPFTVVVYCVCAVQTGEHNHNTHKHKMHLPETFAVTSVSAPIEPQFPPLITRYRRTETSPYGLKVDYGLIALSVFACLRRGSSEVRDWDDYQRVEFFSNF